MVATALAECDEPAEPTAAVNGRRLEDALTGGFFSNGKNPEKPVMVDELRDI